MKCVDFVPKSVSPCPWWKATSELSQLCKMLVFSLRTCCRCGKQIADGLTYGVFWTQNVRQLEAAAEAKSLYFFGFSKKALLQCVPTSREKLDQKIATDVTLLDPVLKHNQRSQCIELIWSTGFLVKACQSWISQALAVLVLFARSILLATFRRVWGSWAVAVSFPQVAAFHRKTWKMDRMSQR